MQEKDSSKASEEIHKVLEEFYNSLNDSVKNPAENSKEVLYAQTKKILSPWLRYFLSYDPKETYQN